MQSEIFQNSAVFFCQKKKNSIVTVPATDDSAAAPMTTPSSHVTTVPATDDSAAAPMATPSSDVTTVSAAARLREGTGNSSNNTVHLEGGYGWVGRVSLGGLR